MSARKTQQAAKLFEAFSGHAAQVVGHVVLPPDDTMVVIGEVEAIAYNALRDGRRESYQHEFKKSSRPMLAVSHDGRRLYLLSGKYEFTGHGIEDR